MYVHCLMVSMMTNMACKHLLKLKHLSMRSKTENYYKLIEMFRQEKKEEIFVRCHYLVCRRTLTSPPTSHSISAFEASVHLRFMCTYAYVYMFVVVCALLVLHCCSNILSYRFIKTHLFCVSYQQSA